MPQPTPAPYLREADLISEPLRLAGEAIDDSYALGVVRQSMFRAEAWRQNNHDIRWRVHDMLYFGNVEPKYWEGTNIERSRLPVPIVFDQVETAHPAIMNALFGGERWFDTAAAHGASPQDVRNIQYALDYILEHSTDGIATSAMTEINFAVHNALQYGNGYVKLEMDPVAGFPQVEWVDLRDLYFDTGNPTPSVDTAKHVIHRRLMTVDDVDKLRSHPKMRIPGRDTLWHMAQNRQWTAGDRSKQWSEASRGVWFNPNVDDQVALPSDQMIEVLVYWSRSKVIWLLNREWVAYNELNPYGFIPYCGAPCFTVTGRHYAMSYADVLEGNQLYIQALMNTRLDELHLALSPPRIRKRGVSVMPSQLWWRPGALTELDNPKEDMVLQFPQNATANIGPELQWMEMGAEKRTGVNGMGAGMPRGGNVNRTATGVEVQTQAFMGRLQTIVKNVEDFLVVPMLYKLCKMIRVHAQAGQKLTGKGPTGDPISIPVEAFFSNPVFTVRGSSRMMTQAKLQGMFPVLAQYLFAGPLIEKVSQLGQTVDFGEMTQLLLDATGIDKRYQLIRPLNDEEKQAMNQPNPQVQAMMQKAQQDAQIRTQAMQLKHTSEMDKNAREHDARTQETEEKSARELLKLLADQQKSGTEIEAVREKSRIEIQGMINKMSLEQQKMMMDMLMKRQQHAEGLQMSRQQTNNDIMNQFLSAQAQRQISAESAAHQRGISAEDAALQRSLTARAHRQQLAMGANKHFQSAEQSDAQHKQKIAQMKTERASAPPRAPSANPRTRGRT